MAPGPSPPKKRVRRCHAGRLLARFPRPKHSTTCTMARKSTHSNAAAPPARQAWPLSPSQAASRSASERQELKCALGSARMPAGGVIGGRGTVQSADQVMISCLGGRDGSARRGMRTHVVCWVHVYVCSSLSWLDGSPQPCTICFLNTREVAAHEAEGHRRNSQRNSR